MNVNRKVGTGFEKDLCRDLSARGFWCHGLTQNAQGQPFDVIAARNGMTYAIDCKDCEKNVFPLSRIEENQRSAMGLWKETGNGTGWFALKLTSGEVFLTSLDALDNLAKQGFTRLNEHQIRNASLSLKAWVSLCK